MSATVPLSKRPVDAFVLLPYLLSHILVFLLIDSQVHFRSIVPYPKFAVNGLDWWIVARNDFLMKETPLWFKSFCLCEAVFQFPLFLALSYGIWKAKPWARIWSVIYGSHTATAMVPILLEFAYTDRFDNETDRYILMSVYLPYLLVPSLMVYRYGFSNPFEAKKAASDKKRN